MWYCPYLQWYIKDVGDDKFVIIYAKDGWYLKVLEERLHIVETGSEEDPELHWTKY